MTSPLKTNFKIISQKCSSYAPLPKLLKRFRSIEQDVLTFCPGCLGFSILIFFSPKTAGLIETKLHLEPMFDGGMKVCSWDLDHLIKMATMSICGKNLLKFSSKEENG